jgi:hypothetical protein
MDILLVVAITIIFVYNEAILRALDVMYNNASTTAIRMLNDAGGIIKTVEGGEWSVNDMYNYMFTFMSELKLKEMITKQVTEFAQGPAKTFLSDLLAFHNETIPYKVC